MTSLIVGPDAEPEASKQHHCGGDLWQRVVDSDLGERFVMNEERLSQSEALYSFLSQSPDPLKEELPIAKKNLSFPLLQFFRNLSGPILQDSNEEEDELYLCDKDLQLREWVSWVFSEPMQVYMLDLLRESIWPEGQLAPEWLQRSEQEQLAARKQAKLLLLENLPR
ncbi:hypothetical protein HPB51_013014 [Rhipicephalus microplus]|uniref:Sorting nexin C-terminal domain-containing protein n=1 Tax=Rhipicephalus microplus TaxID=6941 RepID=A0A9J6F2W5_RHIMP|nr:hypothetical protein HPB51_013014 [Rhipicephalus microplus]